INRLSHGAPMTAPLQTSPARPRIALAGIAIESSTFTPYRSSAADFEVRRGTEEILERYPFDVPDAEYVGILHARTLSGGQQEREVYEGWKAEIVGGISAAVEKAAQDGYFFGINETISEVGMNDAEGDLT